MLTLARGSMLAEQRNYARVPVSLPVRCWTGVKAGEGQSINLSRSGVLFRSPLELTLGENLEVEIEIGGRSRAISSRGTVARLDSTDHVALHFTQISVDDREELGKFLRSHQSPAGL
jgi:hypothetical protein